MPKQATQTFYSKLGLAVLRRKKPKHKEKCSFNNSSGYGHSTPLLIKNTCMLEQFLNKKSVSRLKQQTTKITFSKNE